MDLRGRPPDDARLGDLGPVGRWPVRPADRVAGKKGRSGVLRSVRTRKEFWMDPSHRVRFVDTPKHPSWLNPVEIWFRVLARRVIRRGRFRSTDDRRDRLLRFIEYVNRTMAKPYQWTYAGRPLNGWNGRIEAISWQENSAKVI
jgi:hypothetical protein